MNRIILGGLFVLLLIASSGCQNTRKQQSLTLTSPEQTHEVDIYLDGDGRPGYRIMREGELVIDSSGLGFEFKDQPALIDGFQWSESNLFSEDETWEMPWGEQREVRNKYNGARIVLTEKESPGRKLVLHYRAYEDGIAFRYEFPEQEGRDSLRITEERTEFNLTADHMSWWIPGDWDIYEHLYNTTRVSEINALSKRDHPNLAATYIPENAVNTPVTMRTDEGLHLSFHEADLTDYAGMTLKVDAESLTLSSALVGSERLGYKVRRALPFKTPWRTLQIGDRAGDLIESRLIENLNEPNKLGDISWFTPMKYMGIWWEMHLEKATWDYGMTLDDDHNWVDTGKAHGKHGATTANTMRYIDFAAENDIKGILVEGWNTGWERWIGFEDREGVFDFVTPYPDYDIQALSEYGQKKGVELIMHHETSAAPRTYEQQLDTAYALMEHLGIHSVKTGYVGKIIPKGEYHHGQWMVNHYRRVLETGARYKVAINAHEPIKGTGLRRTYPNAISREGLRGQEFNAWASDGGNPPEHLPIVAFTRMLAGPVDFTPGVFDIGLPQKPNNRVNTTLAQQLALYVVIYSPIQMACDLPENYEGQSAFQFIRDVGVDWEQSKVLNGEVGDYVTIAREERDSGNWFIGAISDENAREVEIDFSFLPEGVSYRATFYKDHPEAHYRDNPTALEIEEKSITRNSKENFHMAAGGGFAISLIRE